MSKYIFSLLLCCISCLLHAQEKDSSTVVTETPVDTAAPAGPITHQLRLSFDVSKFVLNRLTDNRSAYEGSLDYYLQNELYLVADLGGGSSDITYPDLKYTSSNLFIRAGVDKALFVRKKPQDWGLGFIGMRYGVGLVKRNEAQYTTNDGLGGITSGIVPADRFTAHWFELTGGMRVELWKCFFAGWNVRIKFLLNPKSMGDLKPSSIAGYGPGEKATAFDYNFYLAYALRWSSSK